MASFTDGWVVDKTHFEYTMGGTCACCGTRMFLPEGVNGLIKDMSDLETDAANAEIEANKKSPWPPEMREHVWSDRVRLRHKMKKEMNDYKEFWREHGEAFSGWLLNEVPQQENGAKMLRRSFQMPRSEIRNILGQKYNIHSAFGAVIGAVIEQVQHFEKTLYPTDAPYNATAEVQFEDQLKWDRRGGFCLKVYDKKGEFQPHVLKVWLHRMETLGGPKLLDREPKQKTPASGDEDGDEEEGGADDLEPGAEGATNEGGPSFRSDRRVVRLLIARHWADNLILKFKNPKVPRRSDDVEENGS